MNRKDRKAAGPMGNYVAQGMAAGANRPNIIQGQGPLQWNLSRANQDMAQQPPPQPPMQQPMTGPTPDQRMQAGMGSMASMGKNTGAPPPMQPNSPQTQQRLQQTMQRFAPGATPAPGGGYSPPPGGMPQGGKSAPRAPAYGAPTSASSPQMAQAMALRGGAPGAMR
jgi:hypothetical protein